MSMEFYNEIGYTINRMYAAAEHSVRFLLENKIRYYC